MVMRCLNAMLAMTLTLGASCAIGEITSSMLVEMREITSVSPSPDGKLVVVGLCHPNPITNTDELSWIIISPNGEQSTVVIPAGDEIADTSGFGAYVHRRVLWSADAKWFFYPRLHAGEVQLWKTASTGGHTQQVSRLDSDILEVKYSSHSDKIILHLAPTRRKLEEAQATEYRQGLLYDDHVFGGYPLFRTDPFLTGWPSIRRTDAGNLEPPGWGSGTWVVFDVRRSMFEKMPEDEGAKDGVSESDSVVRNVSVVPLSPMPKDKSYYAGQYTLQVRLPSEDDVRCDLAQCIADRLTVLGWSVDRSEIYYLADSVDNATGTRNPGRSAIYAWQPRGMVARLIHDAGGRLYNLQSSNRRVVVADAVLSRQLIVAFTSADQPPFLESIDLQNGAARRLFDPNQSLRQETAGRANWITWDTPSGYPSQGIVVLPDDYQPGHRYPMVVTSYRCASGFLRGGGLDNAPEFVLAGHGFIAVCIHMMVPQIFERENSDFSRLYPAFCDLIEGLIHTSPLSISIDATRVGLSGQSFGANAGTYCISHSHFIAAAAFRHGSVMERVLYDLFETAAWRRDPVNGLYAGYHMPDPRHDPTGRWADISAAERASQISTPTLLQISDTEWLSALPLWSAMRDAHKAVEMYVYPDETHWLRQPTHQLLNFERQVDWFRYWLENEKDSQPSKTNQYRRWDQLRELSSGTSSPT